MTHPDRERDEAELAALFDETAEAPDGMQLTKLRARAADVPGRRRRSRWLAFAPVFAVFAGALAVVVYRGGPSEVETARTTATTTESPVAPSPSSVGHPPEALQPQQLAATEEPDADLEESAPVAGLAAPDDGLGMDGLSAPGDDADERELDRWLAAADSYLGGG